jgi:hypothetical protein
MDATNSDGAHIGPIVPRQRGVRDHARSEVLHRHAKLMKNGRPVFCTPSLAELTGRVPPRQSRGTNGKVIYPTREAAEAAARELEALGSRALRSYVCGRSRRGHFHLTTDNGSHRSVDAGPDRGPSVPAPRRAGTGSDCSLPTCPTADDGGGGDPARPVDGQPLHLRIPRQAGPPAG